MGTDGSREIMVVEDEQFVRASIVDYLEDSGYRVRQMESPLEALESLKISACDAVICDFRMPGMTGLDFLEVARREHPVIPVIILTGMADPVLADEIMAKGAAAYLFKPLPSMKLLLEAVERVITANVP